MEINHLRYFYEVAKAGSFTAASKALRISQPALSKTVAQLEEHESVKLFDRGKKGVTLTPMGELVYAKCDGIFRELEDLVDQVRGRGVRCEGPLRIGASDHIANYLLPKPLSEFHREFPLVFPTVFAGTPADIVTRILDRDMEFGLFFTRIQSAAIEYQELGSIEFVAVFRPSAERVLPVSASKRKEFLSQLGFIGSRTRDYRKRHPAETLLETLGAERKILLETNSQETQKQLALAGYGYAVLPRFMVAAELKRKELAEIPGARTGMDVPLLLAKRKKHVFSMPARQFVERLEKAMKTTKD